MYCSLESSVDDLNEIGVLYAAEVRLRIDPLRLCPRSTDLSCQLDKFDGRTVLVFCFFWQSLHVPRPYPCCCNCFSCISCPASLDIGVSRRPCHSSYIGRSACKMTTMHNVTRKGGAESRPQNSCERKEKEEEKRGH